MMILNSVDVRIMFETIRKKINGILIISMFLSREMSNYCI